MGPPDRRTVGRRGVLHNQTFGELPGGVSVDYDSVQVALEVACFDGTYGRWAIAFGAMLGMTNGCMDPPVFACDAINNTLDSSSVQSVTSVGSLQTYIGLYMTAAIPQGERSAVLSGAQSRRETIQYSVDNSSFGCNDIECSCSALWVLEMQLVRCGNGQPPR